MSGESDKQKKAEAVAKIRKLDEAANTLERGIHGHLFAHKSDFRSEYSALEETVFRYASNI